MEKILLDELSNIISAYKEGKALQFYTSYGEFKDVSAEEFDIEKWYKKPKKFRIKSESKYRPFKDAKECWAEMLKHQPIGWVKRKGNEHYSLITDVDDIKYGISLNERSGFDMNYVWVNYTFADGTLFGVKTEE